MGVSFGLARYGYGLLLPDIRVALDLDSAALGLIGAGAYAAYLTATWAAAPMALRLGARTTIVAGGVLAVVGMLVIAVATGPAMLAGGVFVAGASAGLVYPPFSDVVAREIAPRRRGRALAAISSGTGWGVALAAPLALIAGADWRAAWIWFAGLAFAVAVANALTLPSRDREPSGVQVPRLSRAWLVRAGSGPLLAGALLVGLGSSVYWTFAVDFAVQQGGHSASQARLLLLVVGVASIGGTLAGDLVRSVGGRLALGGSVAVLAVSLGVLASSPGSYPAVLASGALFGLAYNLALAIEAIWSAEVFSDRPSAGLSAVMFALGAGLLAGPAIGGAVAEAFGLAPVLYGAAATVVAVAALLPRKSLLREGTQRARRTVPAEPPTVR